MSSSFWSIDSERSSSSSLSWEESCDEQTENLLQNLLDSIDDVVFYDKNIPKEFSADLVEECLVWRNKFRQKMESNNLKNNNKQSHKLKSLSAPKINSKVGHQQRSQSEQTFVSKVTKLESINTTLHSNAIKEIQNDLNSRMSLKPIILPPIIHPNSSKLKQKTSKVPTICKTFPKPPPVLTIEKILCRSRNLEEKIYSNNQNNSITNKQNLKD